MTWKEFKEAVEAQGVRDDAVIDQIIAYCLDGGVHIEDCSAPEDEYQTIELWGLWP